MYNPFNILCLTCKHCSDIHDSDRIDGISAEMAFYCDAYHKKLCSFRLRCRNYDAIEDEKYTNAEMIVKQLFTMEEYDPITGLFDCSYMRLPPEVDCWHTDCSECKSKWLSDQFKNNKI